MERIVLAYSGEPETSIAIPWLAERYGAEIITVTTDLGQGKELLEEVRDRSLATGALRAHVVDIRDEFARGYIVRALKGGFLGGAGAPTQAVLRRPLVAQKLVTIAHIEQATAVACSMCAMVTSFCATSGRPSTAPGGGSAPPRKPAFNARTM